MAPSSAALSATEQALLAADKPILFANGIPASPPTVKWTEVGRITDADRTHGQYPVYRAWDDDPDLETKTDGTVSSTWYLVFDFDEEIDFDTILIIGHNFGTLSLTQIDVEVDANADGQFTSVWTIPIKTSPTDDGRIIQLDCKHTGADPRRYSGVQYIRLKLTKGSSFTPELHELIVARRRQLKHKPQLGFNPDAWQDEASIAKSKGGSIDKTIFAENQFILSARFKAYETAYINDIKTWWKQVRGSFVWLFEPNTDPDRWNLMMRDEDGLDFPGEGWVKRMLSIHGVEQGPEEWYLENEV